MRELSSPSKVCAHTQTSKDYAPKSQEAAETPRSRRKLRNPSVLISEQRQVFSDRKAQVRQLLRQKLIAFQCALSRVLGETATLVRC